jgi:hypothetical protein
MTTLLSEVFFVIVDYHFIAMNLLCIGFLVNFCYCLLLFFLWVVSTCVLICLILLMDGLPSLIFIYSVCPSWERFLLMIATTRCPQNKKIKSKTKLSSFGNDTTAYGRSE